MPPPRLNGAPGAGQARTTEVTGTECGARGATPALSEIECRRPASAYRPPSRTTTTAADRTRLPRRFLTSHPPLARRRARGPTPRACGWRSSPRQRDSRGRGTRCRSRPQLGSRSSGRPPGSHRLASPPGDRRLSDRGYSGISSPGRVSGARVPGAGGAAAADRARLPDRAGRLRAGPGRAGPARVGPGRVPRVGVRPRGAGRVGARSRGARRVRTRPSRAGIVPGARAAGAGVSGRSG